MQHEFTTSSVPMHANPILAKRHCSATIEHRFWKHVEKTDGCWNWTGCKYSFGYGRIVKRGGFQTMKPHILSWLIHNGEIPDGLCVCHSCDNRACCNPSHLWLGTSRQNTWDMINKGRCPWSVLSQGDVDNIRTVYGEGGITQMQLARVFGVSRQMIGHIVTFKRWKS